jgi:hypothetical protein
MPISRRIIISATVTILIIMRVLMRTHDCSGIPLI